MRITNRQPRAGLKLTIVFNALTGSEGISATAGGLRLRDITRQLVGFDPACLGAHREKAVDGVCT